LKQNNINLKELTNYLFIHTKGKDQSTAMLSRFGLAYVGLLFVSSKRMKYIMLLKIILQGCNSRYEISLNVASNTISQTKPG
jgi:hypothetical protein